MLIARRVARMALATEARRNAAAEAREHQEGAEHHRNRIDRVAEEQHEALDRGDLDEEKAKADGQEIESDPPPVRDGFARAMPQGQGRQDEDEAEHERLNQRRDQDEIAPIEQRRSAEGASLEQVRQGVPSDEIAEGRPVLARWREIELVALDECLAVRA